MTDLQNQHMSKTMPANHYTFTPVLADWRLLPCPPDTHSPPSAQTSLDNWIVSAKFNQPFIIHDSKILHKMIPPVYFGDVQPYGKPSLWSQTSDISFIKMKAQSQQVLHLLPKLLWSLNYSGVIIFLNKCTYFSVINLYFRGLIPLFIL